MPSIDGDPSLSFGNVIGANLSNIGMVRGMACTPYPAATGFAMLLRETMSLVISALAVTVMGLDGSIGSMDAIVLIMGATVFNSFVLCSAYIETKRKRDIVLKVSHEMEDGRPNNDRTGAADLWIGPCARRWHCIGNGTWCGPVHHRPGWDFHTFVDTG